MHFPSGKKNIPSVSLAKGDSELTWLLSSRISGWLTIFNRVTFVKYILEVNIFPSLLDGFEMNCRPANQCRVRSSEMFSRYIIAFPTFATARFIVCVRRCLEFSWIRDTAAGNIKKGGSNDRPSWDSCFYQVFLTGISAVPTRTARKVRFVTYEDNVLQRQGEVDLD